MSDTIQFYSEIEEDDTSIASVSSSFNTARKNSFSMSVPTTGANFKGWLHGLVVQVSAISSSPTKLTFRICTDAAGDKILITDTDGDLFTGISEATEGSVSYRLNLLVGITGQDLYVFWKTDTGTCTIDSVMLSWYM